MTCGARLKLCELREFVSNRSGKHYLSGFLGGARVVVVRDDRAECTGREVARWTVFLEEQPPREDRRDRAKEPMGGRPVPAHPNVGDSHAARPEARHRVKPTALKTHGRRTAIERQAERILRSRGIDPDADPASDELPF